MRIKFFIIALSLCAGHQSHAQDTLTLYYDKKGKEVLSDKADYIRKKFRNGDEWGVIDYYKSGKLNMKGNYLDDSCTHRQGEFIFYDKNGNPMFQMNFLNDKADGPYSAFYPNGKKHSEGNYKIGKMDGDWTGHYESGNISAKAHYENGKQQSASFYNEDGTANHDITVFFRDASYPGGATAWHDYLVSQLRYPNSAVKNNIEGRVLVEFTIEKSGDITDISVVQSVEESLDKEALRVIKKMPKWEPAIVGGIVDKQTVRQPVVFALRSK
ncbi:MAG TPA: TonB family protein [Puia sp.]|nr:TonB family protein [Puia sp.]